MRQSYRAHDDSERILESKRTLRREEDAGAYSRYTVQAAPNQEEISCRPMLESANAELDRAFRIAATVVAGNIQPFKDGMLERSSPCLIAGLDYDTPWTRDAAFNTWYGLGLLYPEVAKNTLMSVLIENKEGELSIGGQYWDAIIWAHGAWQYYLHTGDREFLDTAFPALVNSLNTCEIVEYDASDGLFRGGGCFQDGVSAYPDYFAPDEIPFSAILDWSRHAKHKRSPTGGGIPCKALSTNCLYVRAYEVSLLMAEALGRPGDPSWRAKKDRLREAINSRFWSSTLGRYKYLVDAPGDDERQEGLGLAFALLFGVADKRQVDAIFENVYLSPHGIPCVWPTFDRYARLGEFGRQSGPIWPQVNAAWALACQRHGRESLAHLEVDLLAKKACRDVDFIEVYHPETGLPYGGLQEHEKSGTMEYFPVRYRQSWCASGFIGMVAFCLFGLDPSENGLNYRVTTGLSLGRGASLKNFWYKGKLVTLGGRLANL